ncbi:hypothetical protein ACJMK2_041094 [Sinanodonta woodiana]|uniref:Tyrosine-protein kinase n=1 Tax=Sinanodonta woodiana TaxID=1069815 RepID=A0ABD3W4U9_SINWO
MATGGTPPGQIKPSSALYFYGRITRDEAEIILKERGCVEGMYLLRESINPLGNYAISLCHDGKVHHYVIEKQPDGSFMIPQGRKFNGPIELIAHHQESKDGIITQLSVPCNRLPYQSPVAFRGMTYTDLEAELLGKAKSMKGVKMERALGPQREHLIIMVARDLHFKQPWYHKKIGRDEGAKRLQKSGHKDGKFLVRQRDDGKTYALSVSYHADTRHYCIDKTKDNKYGIQDGPKFDCIMMLIDHYHNKQDGLLCKLTEPCPAPNFDAKLLQKYMENSCDNLQYLKVGQDILKEPGIPTTMAPPPPTSTPDRSSRRESNYGADGNGPPPLPSMSKRPSIGNTRKLPNNVPHRPLPPTPGALKNVNEKLYGEWGGDDAIGANTLGREGLSRTIGMSGDEMESIYGRLPRNEASFSLNRNQIDLQDTLGSGQFGSVCKGMCTMRDGTKIPVAVKTLKNEEVTPGNEPELIKEAKLMQNLSHKNIVRMIGLCKADCIMLVLELAPLGPLNSYLSNHRDTSQGNIVELLWQVAMGMAYLESKKFVHRDLAARNVLLVTEHFAKISDFGMSKALGRENNYYEAREAGKWPLKWYAPECVFYWKFDSKSDVWSYGITLWEASSYGAKPYQKMKGQEILKFLVEDNQRLEKPPYCPDSVYNVMLHCWEYEKELRPTFMELATTMEELYREMSYETVSFPVR